MSKEVAVDVDKFARFVNNYIELRSLAEWLVSLDDDDPNSPGRQDRKTITLNKIISRAKESLGD